MSDYINLTLENIENEHICCAIADKKHSKGVEIKKNWLKERIREGHIFRKLNTKGKIFIEYAPLEKAWTPVIGDNYIYIYCLWVAGSYKGNGYGRELLEYAIEDAKKQNKDGICTISSKKKKPFLGEEKFFNKYGFKVVDAVGEYELLSLDFKENKPQFSDSVKKGTIKEKELTIFYSPQCPYTNNCIQEIEEFSKNNKVQINIKKIDTLEKAKNMPCIFNNWAYFREGEFISNALLNSNMLVKMLKD